MKKLYAHHQNSQVFRKWFAYYEDKIDIHAVYVFVHKPNMPQWNRFSFRDKINTYIANCIPYCERNYISFINEKDMEIVNI